MAINLNGRTLTEALAARMESYGIHAVDGVLVSDDDAACQAVIDAYTVEDAQNAIASDIDAHAKALIDRVIAPYSPGEMAGWPIMRAEALAMQQDAQADTPNIDLEAQVRGVDRAVIRDRVLANATALQTTRAAILGTAGRHKDAVRALSTHAAIVAYDWREGWPL